jgi:hypothetical protein
VRARIAPGLNASVLAKKEAIVGAWLDRTLRTYPEQTYRFLTRERDPFRNPLVPALEEVLPSLFDEVFGDMNAAVLTACLDRVIRYRAVQDLDADQAAGFVLLLKPVVREALAGAGRDTYAEPLDALDERIDDLARLAFHVLAARGERVREIRANEARRRVAVQTRMRAREASLGRPGPGG